LHSTRALGTRAPCTATIPNWIYQLRRPAAILSPLSSRIDPNRGRVVGPLQQVDRFVEVNPMPHDRRTFIKTASAATAGLSLAPASSYARILGANDRVRVGVVGFSDRLRGALVPAFQQHAKELNFEIVAASDIWSLRREQAAAQLEKATGLKPALCRNNDELYDRQDVDAVIIATADFQHALHGVEAVRAGRDAYVEKPMANTMADARALRKAVVDTKKIVQIGTQRRSAANYQRAYEFLKSGQFGDIIAVEMTWTVNQPGRWRRPYVVPVLVGHSRSMAGPSDRHRPLVHRAPPPAQRRRQRRHLPVEGWPEELGYLHGGVRLRPARRCEEGLPGDLLVAADQCGR
jgi:hypothetical protein